MPRCYICQVAEAPGDPGDTYWTLECGHFESPFPVNMLHLGCLAMYLCDGVRGGGYACCPVCSVGVDAPALQSIVNRLVVNREQGAPSTLPSGTSLQQVSDLLLGQAQAMNHNPDPGGNNPAGGNGPGGGGNPNGGNDDPDDPGQPDDPGADPDGPVR
jgi:hypothetical protein